MISNNNFYDELDRKLRKLDREQQLRSLRRVPEHCVNLTSNDYLGLRSDADLRSLFRLNAAENGFEYSASSSRLLTGNTSAAEELEEKLADLFKREAALLFNSGYHANVGILPALTGKDDLIIADKLVHASLIDGMKLANGSFVRFRHNDYEQLEALLLKNRPKYRNLFIVTESIFSMDGDCTDVRRMVELKKRYDALLYVDEAHAFGTRGRTGLGLCQEQGVVQDVDFIVGTFGKAIASQGAFVVCKSNVRKWLINRMRTLIYTTALPPVSLQWTRHVLTYLPRMVRKRERLRQLVDMLHSGLNGSMIQGKSFDSHIIPIICGSNRVALQASEYLLREGFYALPLRSPTVPKGTERLRISLSAAISDMEIDRLINVLNGYAETLDSKGRCR